MIKRAYYLKEEKDIEKPDWQFYPCGKHKPRLSSTLIPVRIMATRSKSHPKTVGSYEAQE